MNHTVRIKSALPLTLISFGLVFSQAAQANPVTVNYLGTNYTITSTETRYDLNPTFFTSQPWWGNAALSVALADLVRFQVGGNFGGAIGAFFGYGISVDRVNIAYWGGAAALNCPSGCPSIRDNFLYANALSVSVPVLVTLASVADSLTSTASGIDAINTDTNLIISGAHSRPMSRRVAAGEKTFWLAGDWGTDDHGNNNGSLGLAEVGGGYNFGPAQVNLSIGYTWAKQDLINNGDMDADGNYVMVEGIIPVSENHGLFATIGAFGHWGKSDIRRGYLNVGAAQSSKGDADTNTWALRARLDWQNAFAAKTVLFSPYADINYYNSHMDGYTETGGGLPARFNSRNDDRTDIGVGVNAAMPISGTDLQLVANLGAVHSFNDEGARTSGEVIGLFGFNLDGQDLDNNWVKAGAGVEGMLGKGKASIMLNGTTEGQMSNAWVAASYQLAF